MGPEDNGFGGNIVNGAASDIEGVLKSVQGSLTRIDSLLKDIGSSFANMKKSVGSGGGPPVAGNTGQATPAMPTPGADSSGFGAMGMFGGMAASWISDKALSGAMSVYKDAMPSIGDALTYQQLNYNFGVYAGRNANSLIQPGSTGRGFAQQLSTLNKFGTSSSTGYAAMSTGLMKTGAIAGTGRGSLSVASGFADLYPYAGVTNEQAVQLANQSIGPQTEISMMALGYKSPVKADGSARNPFAIASEIMDATTGGRGFSSKQSFKRQWRDGGLLHANFEATGQPMEYMEIMPYIQDARTEYEKSGKDWNELSTKQQIEQTKTLTGLTDTQLNPQASDSENMTYKALKDMGLSKAVFDTWKAANDRINQYMGYLSNLPLLDPIARAYGYNARTQEMEGGLTATTIIPAIASFFGIDIPGNWGMTGEGNSTKVGLDQLGSTGSPIPEGSAGHPPDTGYGVKGGDATAGLPTGNALGDWNVGKDMISKIHQGEMILPSRIAESVRADLASGGRPPQNTPSEAIPPRGELSLGNVGATGVGGSAAQVTINVSVAQASQEEAVRFAEMVKGILQQETYLSAVGKGHGY